MERRWVVPIVLLAVIVAYWWLRPRPRNVIEAYVGERSATLWSSVAQVREPVATLRYGEKVEVLERKGEQVEIRTGHGLTGWVEARQLMDPGAWQSSVRLLRQARAMPAQATGRTKAISNVRIEPGRAASRIYQFARGAPVEVMSRAVVEWSASSEENPAAAKEASPEEQKPRREDWLLVRGMVASGGGPGGIESVVGKSEEHVPIAGWVLARFIELDLPGPVRDYAASSNMRVIACFELNRVADRAAEKPQYLAAGVRGGEGQPCDFTMIRVYTWGAQRQRYETAYVESNLCGRLPIRVGKSASGDPEFRFNALVGSGGGERVYRMHQTVVRRVRLPEHAAPRARR